MTTKTERLFALLQFLREYRYPVSGQILADKLNVSLRTVYRDISALQSQGAEIEGEAGLGFQLKPGFLLPPLMFNSDELDALMLGARWVIANTDNTLQSSARRVVAKIDAILPKSKRANFSESSMMVGPSQHVSTNQDILNFTRQAIQQENKLDITYQDAEQAITTRTVWPIGIAFLDEVRMLIAWCELRRAFRHFRLDRLSAINKNKERYPTPRHQLIRNWRKQQDIAES